MAYTDHDLTNDLKIKSVDKPQDIFAEPSNEFIDKALQKISKIPDYVPLNFDVYGRAPKEKQCAWWKCTHAPKETKAIRWYGRGKTEISVDEDEFAPEDIESFAAIAKKTVKPQAERKLTEAQRLKLKLIKIVGNKYRRSYGSGAIYERQTDYYYTYKYSDPKLFLNHIFANDESYQLSSKKESDELLHFIKYTVHPGFAFMTLDHSYIGFSNGVFDLSTAKVTNAADAQREFRFDASSVRFLNDDPRFYSCPVKGKGSIEVLDWNIPTLINANHMPNYKDEAGEIVRRLMIVEFGKQVPDDEVDVELEQKIKDQEFATFLHRCRSKYIEFKTKYASKKVTAFAPQSFIDRSNEFRETANNSYGFATGNVAYEEGAEISRSEMRRHLLVWIQEKFGLDKLP
ncbi:unnamed protein product [Phytophthora lilii]|uniref:Unnamed protein product n=1 Tax=Phytophthora lilii TaxID=2077276 RepID=A0A9W6XES1_9STRA|nr:unnamed protein product [Phytophthora lilii]